MTFLRKMIFSTKNVKFFDTFAEQDNSFFSFSLLFLPIFSVLSFHFFSSVYRKVCVSMDISLNIRGYFITYPRIFHYVSVDILLFACLLATFRAYSLSFLLAVFCFSHSINSIGGKHNPERASQHIREELIKVSLYWLFPLGISTQHPSLVTRR